MLELFVVIEKVTFSPEETREVAREIFADFLSNNKADLGEKVILVLLSGGLGAGKTQFVKGIAEVLGIHKIKSPSYTYVHEHSVDREQFSDLKQFVHVDAWRIESASDAASILVESYFAPGTILVVEWADRLAEVGYHFGALAANIVPFEVKIDDQASTESRRVIAVF